MSSQLWSDTSSKNSSMTSFLPVNMKLVRQNDYVKMQVFVFHENRLAKELRRQNGENN